MKRPHICLWKDLSVGDMETLEGAYTIEEMHRVLSKLLPPGVGPSRAPALLDLYYHTARFCRDHTLTREQTNCLLSITMETHITCSKTWLGNVDECFQYFRELLLYHAVHRPPFSVAVFTEPQLQLISRYFLSTYIRHFKLYKYVFTPQVHLDLSISYDGDWPAGETSVGDPETDTSAIPAAGTENDGKGPQREEEAGPPNGQSQQKEAGRQSRSARMGGAKDRTGRKRGSARGKAQA